MEEQEPANTLEIQETECTPKFFISIDPGLTNLANICGTYKTDPVKNKVTLVIFKNRIKNEKIMGGKDTLDVQVLHKKLNCWALQQVDTVKESVSPGALALIEKQSFIGGLNMTSVKLQILQALVLALLERYGMFVEFINPSHYKQVLEIATGDHGQNKKAALKLAKEMVGPTYENLIFDDHVADALNQAVWYFSKLYKDLYNKVADVDIVFE
jgi:hypothetical protein